MPVEAIRHSSPNFATEDTGSDWTPDVWQGIHVEGIRNGLVDGHLFERYFQECKPIANVNAAEAYWDQGMMIFGSDGASATIATGLGKTGGMTFASDGDNEGISIRQVQAPFKLARASKRLAFEVVLSTSTITDTKHGFLVGLSEATAQTVTDPITALGAIADRNLVGFHRLEADGDKLDIVYKANGVTQVTLAADAIDLAVDTDVRLGITYDNLRPDFNLGESYICRFWKNGRVISSGYKKIPNTDGDDFPNDVSLCFFFALMNATGSTPGNTTLRRVRIAQER